MKKLRQLLFSSADQIAFLEWWLETSEVGLTNQQFCEALVKYGDEGTTKNIGQDGIAAPSQGKKFTDVLAGWLPAPIIAAVEASEHVGDRQSGLKAAIIQLSGGHSIIAQLIKVSWFPYSLLWGIGAVSIYVSHEILASSREKGLGNQIYDFVSLWGAPILIGFLALFLLLAFALPNWAGPIRRQIDNWPIFNIYHHSVGANLLSSLSCLISCGLTIDKSLDIIAGSASPYLKGHISQISEQKVGQMNLGNMLDTGLLIPKQLGTLKILGSHTDFSPLLKKSADAHNLSIQKRLKLIRDILPKVGLLIVIAELVIIVGSALYQILSVVNF
ncbi:hypothetical protein QMU85_002061 [Photobacterium damselae]|nr:hypothetical protein [Photobacterium damselae]